MPIDFKKSCTKEMAVSHATVTGYVLGNLTKML
jgi:hypothetical protein